MTTTANIVVGLPFKMFPRSHQNREMLEELFEEFYCASPDELCPSEIIYGWCVVEAMEGYECLNGYDVVKDIEIKRAAFYNEIGKQAQIILTPNVENEE